MNDARTRTSPSHALSHCACQQRVFHIYPEKEEKGRTASKVCHKTLHDKNRNPFWNCVTYQKKNTKKQCNKTDNRSKISLIWNLLESNMFLVLNQDNWQKAFLVVKYFLAVEGILYNMRNHIHVRYYGKRFLSFLLTLVVKKWEMHDLAFPIIILSFKNKTKN